MVVKFIMNLNGFEAYKIIEFTRDELIYSWSTQSGKGPNRSYKDNYLKSCNRTNKFSYLNMEEVYSSKYNLNLNRW